ncbi:ferric reductase like transmembrane component-domain-containing protein [Armillaria nabsnona]|nr:ferric reductase like transmembrane component-domain-containing protein [Armillaria nabsnona]
MASYTSAANATAATGAAASGGAAQAAAAATAGPGVDEENLTYHIEIFVLAIIALLFVCRIPRIIARFSRWSEWTQGHFLRNVSFMTRSPRIIHLTHDETSKETNGSSADSHTLYTHATSVKRIDGKGGPAVMNYPPHVGACPAIFRGLSTELSTRILPGYSVSQVICGLVYLSVFIYPTLYKSNPFSDPVRTGWVAIAQLPFIFAFTSKNNVLGPFLGLGYEKLNFMHRIAGMIMVIAVNVHGIGYIYKWVIAGDFQQDIAKPANYWGLIGLICVDILYFFSTDFWRKKAYNVFLGTHMGGFTFLLIASWMHKEADKPYVLAAIGLYSFDFLLRCIKTRIQTAIVRPIPELGLTRLEIPGINAGWRAGQHVRLRVMSSGMGILGWAEVHPFTIASASNSPEGMILMVKKVGGWTNSLYNIAKVGGYVEAGRGRNLKVMVEGPYGGPGHTIPASFSASVFVVGGSGITFAIAGLQELIQKDLDGKSRVKVIELIWVVQDPAALVPLIPTFTSMIEQSVFTPVRISVFYTRAVIGKFPFRKDFFFPGLSLSPGRPKLATMFEGAISKTVQLGAGVKDEQGHSGMLVSVCGPTSLADDVAQEVGKIDPLRRDQVGGVEIHEDVFGW